MLTSTAGVLLRWLAPWLPADRRDWLEAVRAEASNVPAGRERLNWMLGGLWLAATQAHRLRNLLGLLVAVTVGAAAVWLDWHPGSANPAMPTNRVTTIVLVMALALLPWFTRAVLGPVADNRPARIVRAGGYTAVYAVLLVMVGLSRFASSRFDHFRAFDQANWEAEMRSGAIVGGLLLVLVMGGYALTILAITSRRAAVAPSTLAIGATAGAAVALVGYALMPLGNPRHFANGWIAAGAGLALFLVPLVVVLGVGVLARHRAGSRPLRQGAIAGLCAGGAAALLLNILTVGTMLLWPEKVDLKWANPDPTVAHGTPYEVRMSVGDAAIKYEAGLLLGPVAGLVLGALGALGLAGAATPPPPRRRAPADRVTASI